MTKMLENDLSLKFSSNQKQEEKQHGVAMA